MAKLRPHMGPTRFTTWTAPGSALPVSWDLATAFVVAYLLLRHGRHRDAARWAMAVARCSPA
jgi:hypothetical protein